LVYFCSPILCIFCFAAAHTTKADYSAQEEEIPKKKAEQLYAPPVFISPLLASDCNAYARLTEVL